MITTSTRLYNGYKFTYSYDSRSKQYLVELNKDKSIYHSGLSTATTLLDFDGICDEMIKEYEVKQKKAVHPIFDNILTKYNIIGG